MGYKAGQPVFCSICGKIAVARKLCRNHYVQAWKKGALDPHPKVTQDESFDIRVQKTETCWIWTGSRNEAGYGIFLLPGEIPVRAHRYLYEREIGPIPEGIILMHSCDNPPCVNPAHLRPGTHGDNIRDAAKKRRLLFGETHHQTKLMTAEIEAIRADLRSNAIVARDYRINPSTVSRIRARKRRTYE